MNLQYTKIKIKHEDQLDLSKSSVGTDSVILRNADAVVIASFIKELSKNLRTLSVLKKPSKRMNHNSRLANFPSFPFGFFGLSMVV